ncbi:conserved hypothetical protein [Pseudomonas sp. 8AS]|uniref:hypothetical protein n=1 Tax=Pseudomonas sp. 8AS TaxID=2653163 RepID=UPI0012F1A210|nr:hypothetical protein [Pseudomonas sp. 8AS]VXA99717.1 conserved hypothetical protein [Pseudomonas sp. 8AS]
MNATAPRYFVALALGLLLSEARAEYWTIDEQVKDFNAVSAQIGRGELQAAEQGLAALQQHTARNDVRIEQYQRELAGAYLNQGKQQLAAHNPQAAAAALARAEPYMAKAPGLKQDYQASLAAVAAGGAAQPEKPRKAAPAQAAAARPQVAERQAAAQPPAASQAAAAGAPIAAPDERREEVERRLREAEAIIAKKEAERVRQQQLAEEQATALAEREAAAAEQRATREAASAAPAVVAAAPQVVSKPQDSGRARLIDPSASSSSVAMPMLDANDRDSLRTLLDAVAADVVAFDCAVRLEVREAKDYPFVAALLSARIKKLDPSFTPQFSPVLKPDQEPRLVLSPQSNS